MTNDLFFQNLQFLNFMFIFQIKQALGVPNFFEKMLTTHN